MLRKLLAEKETLEQPLLLEAIYESIQKIQQKLEEEIISKQAVIDGSWNEIRTLRQSLQEKDRNIQQLEKTIADCQRNAEGNRQIINKLLNDLDRRQQDIEWYKRTYETRSLLGTIKEKILGRGANKTR